MNDLLTILTQRDNLVVFLAVLSFLVSVVILLVAVFRKETESPSTWKLFGTFLVIFLALLANNVVVYGLAIFIIATLVTNLQFLLDLASIFWDRSWWKVEKASPEDVKKKVEQQVQKAETVADMEAEESRQEALVSTNQPSGGIGAVAGKKGAFSKSSSRAMESDDNVAEEAFDTMVERTLDLRQEILNRLENTRPFGGNLIQNLRFYYRGRPRHLIDAVLEVDGIHYLCEVRMNLRDGLLHEALANLRHYISIYRIIKEDRVAVKGLLIVPEIPMEEVVDNEIAVVRVDTSTGEFKNVQAVREWMQES